MSRQKNIPEAQPINNNKVILKKGFFEICNGCMYQTNNSDPTQDQCDKAQAQLQTPNGRRVCYSRIQKDAVRRAVIEILNDLGVI